MIIIPIIFATIILYKIFLCYYNIALDVCYYFFPPPPIVKTKEQVEAEAKRYAEFIKEVNRSGYKTNRGAQKILDYWR